MKKSKEILKNQISAVNELRESEKKNKLLYSKNVFDKSEKDLKQEYNINYDLYKQALKEIKKYQKEFVENFKDFDIDMQFFKSFKKYNPQIFKFLCNDKTIQKYVYKYYFTAIKTNNNSIAENIKNTFDIDDSIKKDPRYFLALKEGILSIINDKYKKEINTFISFLNNFNINPSIAQSFNIKPSVEHFLNLHNQ